MLRFIQSPIARHVLAFCVAYAGSRFLLASAGFRYDLFGEPFNAAKLAVDFGVWALIYLFVLRVLTRGANRQPPKPER